MSYVSKVLAILAIWVGFLSLTANAAESTPKLKKAPTPVAASPADERQAVTRFYESYMGYLNGLKGKSRSLKRAESGDRAATAPFITDDFKKRLGEQAKKCASKKDEILPGCDNDAFHCAQETPNYFVVAGVPSPGLASVQFKIGSMTYYADLHLKKGAKGWLIDRVDCR